MIKVRNVNKYFNKNKLSEIHVLNDIDVQFSDKGLVILKGVSGSGKTTLLNVLGGLDRINSGEICVDNESIRAYKTNIWDTIRTKKIGYIFQNYYLIPKLTVFENVSIVLKMIGVTDELEIERRVHYILKQVGMYNFRKRNANQLSGGQQQRVAIARALVKNPKIIIADEPSGNLDSKNTIEIMNIIKKISKQRLVVLVTHEQSIADFYGDRIIEITDGKIVDDYPNESSEPYSFVDNDSYYLKDFKYQDTFGNFNFYSNSTQEDLKDKVKVSLIYENDCLVLDVTGSIKKVRLASENSGIKVLDEHNQSVDKNTFLDTDYQTDEIKIDEKQQNKENIYTFKNNFKNAVLNFLNMTKLKKTMIIGLMISGMITAVASSIIGNRFFDDYVGETELENYVYFTKQSYSMEIEEISSLSENDSSFWINPYPTESIRISIPSTYTTAQTYELEGSLDLIDHISEEDIIYGRMPENIYEIVVDLSVYTNNNDPFSELTKFGVWSPDQLLGEKVFIRESEIEIVGISDVSSQLIFGDRTTLTLLSFKSFGITSYFLSLELLGEGAVELVDGSMPVPGSKEVLIPYNYGNGVPSWAFDNGPYERNGVIISGTYDKATIPFDRLLYLAYNTDIENYVFMQTIGDMRVYTNNPQDLLDKMEDQDLIASWSYGDTLIEAGIEQNKLMPILYISILILLFSGLGFYYMMRSSMLSRIYEISVYRALGMKKSSIMRGFTAELLVVTTTTTLIGYSFASLLILNFQSISYLKSIAYINGSSFILGILMVYIINLVFGRISIRRQLSKTPAELLSNYDM
jgi:ABC-type lipoprotein export system ATPase subunit